MSPQLPPQLPEIIAKFLNFLQESRGFSQHTIRAYKVDLSQAYELDKYGELARHQKSTDRGALGGYFFTHYIDKKSGSRLEPPKFAQGEILDKSMKALSLWSHLSSATRNRKAASIKSFLKWSYESGLLDEPLDGKIPLVKKSQKIPNFLSVDESISLIKAITEAENSREQQRDLTLILLLYGCGLRISEACDLRLSQIDFSGGTLRVLGKGAKERIVAMPLMTRNQLKKYTREYPAKPFIFGGEGLNSRKAYQIVRDWGARAGLKKDLHPHALRHSFATQLLVSGANLRTLQKVLGHESLTATQIYTHLDRDHLSSVMDQHHPLGSRTSKKLKNR